MRESLVKLLEPEISALGLELLELEFHPQGRGGVLRLYLDRPDGPSGPVLVTIEDCEAVSRRVSAVLDVSDPIPGEYTLEVSSPGFDRPLRTAAHFSRYLGCRAKVESLVPRDGRRRWTGEIREVDGSRVRLEVDGQMVDLDVKELKMARLVPEFGSRRE
jgi:ribosome maturation factor RimP